MPDGESILLHETAPLSFGLTAAAIIPNGIAKEEERDGFRFRIPAVLTKKAILHLPGCFGPNSFDEAFFRATATGDLNNAIGIMALPHRLVPQPSSQQFIQMLRYVLTLPAEMKPPSFVHEASSSPFEIFGDVARTFTQGQSQWCTIHFKRAAAETTNFLPAGLNPLAYLGYGAKAATKILLPQLEPDFEATTQAMDKTAATMHRIFDETILSTGATNATVLGHSLGGWLAAKYALNYFHNKLKIDSLIMASVPLMEMAMKQRLAARRMKSICVLSKDDPLRSILKSWAQEVVQIAQDYHLVNFSVHETNGHGHVLPVDLVVQMAANSLHNRPLAFGLS